MDSEMGYSSQVVSSHIYVMLYFKLEFTRILNFSHGGSILLDLPSGVPDFTVICLTVDP